MMVITILKMVNDGYCRLMTILPSKAMTRADATRRDAFAAGPCLCRCGRPEDPAVLRMEWLVAAHVHHFLHGNLGMNGWHSNE